VLSRWYGPGGRHGPGALAAIKRRPFGNRCNDASFSQYLQALAAAHLPGSAAMSQNPLNDGTSVAADVSSAELQTTADSSSNDNSEIKLSSPTVPSRPLAGGSRGAFELMAEYFTWLVRTPFEMQVSAICVFLCVCVWGGGGGVNSVREFLRASLYREHRIKSELFFAESRRHCGPLLPLFYIADSVQHACSRPRISIEMMAQL
jgi:hypothetical protein